MCNLKPCVDKIAASSLHHAKIAVTIGKAVGLLNQHLFHFQDSSRLAGPDDIEHLQEWLSTPVEENVSVTGNQPLEPIPTWMLTPDQDRAFQTVRGVLHARQNRHECPPLKMLIFGEAGSGKTSLIQTISHLYQDSLGDASILKLSLTQLGADLINGSTIERVFQLNRHHTFHPQSTFGQSLVAKLSQTQLLIIDNVSMLAAASLALISDRLTDARASQALCSTEALFGDIDVILCGDLHQLQPIASDRRIACIRNLD